MCPIRVARSSTQAKAPVLVRGSRAQSSARGASPVAVSRAEAICMGFTETSGLRSASPSSSKILFVRRWIFAIVQLGKS